MINQVILISSFSFAIGRSLYKCLNWNECEVKIIVHLPMTLYSEWFGMHCTVLIWHSPFYICWMPFLQADILNWLFRSITTCMWMYLGSTTIHGSQRPLHVLSSTLQWLKVLFTTKAVRNFQVPATLQICKNFVGRLKFGGCVERDHFVSNFGMLEMIKVSGFHTMAKPSSVKTTLFLLG